MARGDRSRTSAGRLAADIGDGDSDRKPAKRPEPAPCVAARMHGADNSNEKAPRIVPVAYVGRLHRGKRRASHRYGTRWRVLSAGAVARPVLTGGRMGERGLRGAGQLVLPSPPAPSWQPMSWWETIVLAAIRYYSRPSLRRASRFY
jgi:hypothetical protein